MPSSATFKMVSYTPVSKCFHLSHPRRSATYPTWPKLHSYIVFFLLLFLHFLNDSNTIRSLWLSISLYMKLSCTYCSPLWSTATIISSQVLTVLSFPPRSASFHLHEFHQIIWNITLAAAVQEVPDEAVRFTYEGKVIKETQRGGEFYILLRVEFWIIINVIHLASSATIGIGDSPLTLRLRFTQETKLVPMETDLSCHCWSVK